MKKGNVHVLLAAGMALGLACNNAAEKTASDSTAKDSTASTTAAFDLEKAKTAVADMNRQYEEAVKKGDTVALAAFYSSDGMMLAPNSEPVKKEGIAADWGASLRMGMKGLKLFTDDLAGDADLLIETGHAEVYADKDKLIDKGKYVVVWKPENGSWKIYRDIFNSSMPLPKK